MDVQGARVLHKRIETRQRLHWETAAAVREGRQEPVDPDAERLVRIADNVREYVSLSGERFQKALVNGRWTTTALADTLQPSSLVELGPAGGVALISRWYPSFARR
jgi:hypothetical protein